MKTRYRLFRLLGYNSVASTLAAIRFPFVIAIALDNIARRLQERRIINAEVYIERTF